MLTRSATMQRKPGFQRPSIDLIEIRNEIWHLRKYDAVKPVICTNTESWFNSSK
jgi:hypothetical protein